jgi:hypothetical protein
MHATIYFIRIIVDKKKKRRRKKEKRGSQAHKCMFLVCHEHSETQ